MIEEVLVVGGGVLMLGLAVLVLLAGMFVYALCVVASDADDRQRGEGE